jgi:hypothetical protein
MVQHLDVPALKKQWVLDAQWTDCPKEVEQTVKDLWRMMELGNDNYMLRRSIADFFEWFGEEGLFRVERWFWGETAEEQKGWVDTEVSVMPLVDYLRAQGVADDEEVVIHWWW